MASRHEDGTVHMGHLLPAVALLALAVAALLLVIAPAVQASGVDRVTCTGCHEDFVPFTYSHDVPQEVPTDEPFTIAVTVTNGGQHRVSDLRSQLTIQDPQGMTLSGGEPSQVTVSEQGSLGMRGQASHDVPVLAGAEGATFTARSSGGGPLTLMQLVVTGPGGGRWESASFVSSATISLDLEELHEGGFGDYRATISRVRGALPASYALEAEVAYGASSTIAEGPELATGESHTFTFELRGVAKGANGVTFAITGTCQHAHMEAGHDEEAFTESEEVPITVGDRFVQGGSDGDGGGGGDGLLAAGQALGFISAGLLATSIATSGRLPRLPRRARVHCWTSNGLLGTLLLHWTLLWAGPYGAIWGGIGTGAVLLALVAVLTVTAVRPQLLEGRLLGLPSRRLHLLATLALVALLGVHALLNGTHFEWVRAPLGL